MVAEPNKRRVSYIIPPPESDTPLLNLPSFGTVPTDDRYYPLLERKPSAPATNGTSNGTRGPLASRNPFLQSPPPPAAQPLPSQPPRPRHPRHRLGVSSLALDTSTVLSGADSPGGILYTGGRDGLVASWELHVPHSKRRGRRYRPIGRGQRVRWERLGDGGEDWNEEEDDGDQDQGSFESSDDDDDELNSRIPYEDKWEIDRPAIARQPPSPTTFRQSVQTHTDWVNAMTLCNMNQTVITASSDRTIRAWSPHAEGEPAVPALIGYHTDYVRSLAFARHPGILFSGALDRDIAIWDIASPRPNEPVLKVRLSDKDDGCVGLEGEWGSIYALGVDPMGHTLAAGTPERVVRLWDPRAGDNSVTKLVGHTECVRSIVISDDGRYMLTGSSDTTVKLWSIGENRCLHTFNHHTSSVWALHSTHPNLERFYSGSRDGHLCVVDVEQCGDMSEGECVVLAREGDSGRPGDYESKTGDEAIRSIVAMDDEYVWTATSSSDVHRWRDVGRRVCRMDPDLELDDPGYVNPGDESQPLVNQPDVEPQPIIDSSPMRNKRIEGGESLKRIDSQDSRSVAFAPSSVASPASPPANSALPASIRGRLSHGHTNSIISEASVLPPDESRNGIPYESLVCLGLPDSPYHFGFSGATHSQLSVNSANRARSPEDSPEAPFNEPRRGDARRAFEDRDVASEAQPLRREPDAIIDGSPGLIRSLILNDRLHVLTLDTQGEVAIWHLIRGECLGRFSQKDVAEALELERGVEDARMEIKLHPHEVLELVQRRIEGKNAVLPWCQVDTKVGQITVHLEGDRVFAAEILAEELGIDERTLPKDINSINIGKVALSSLFRGLIKAEEQEVQSIASSSPQTQPSSLPSISRSPVAPMNITLPPGAPRHRARAMSSASSSGLTPAINIAGLATPAAIPAVRPTESTTTPFGQSAPAASGWLAARREGFGHSPTTPLSASLAKSGDKDYFSLGRQASSGGGDSAPKSPAPVTSPPAKTKKTWFGKKKTAEPMAPLAEERKEPLDSGPQLSDRDRAQLMFLDQLRSKQFHPPGSETPLLPLPASTNVIVSEQAHADGAYMVTYRSQVSGTERDLEPLEMNSPYWLLDFLFTNAIPDRVVPKIPIILLPEGTSVSSGKGLKVQASRTARVRGVIEHLSGILAKEEETAPGSVPRGLGALVRDRSQSNASNMSGISRPRPEDLVELVCGEHVALPEMKVGSLKQFYWRGGPDMVLHYRPRGVSIASSAN